MRRRTTLLAAGLIGLGLLTPSAHAALGDLLHTLQSDSPTALLGFGETVAIDDGVVAVGSRLQPTASGAENAGSVYLFDAATGHEITQLRAPSTYPGQGFGWKVALDNGVLVVSADVVAGAAESARNAV